MKKSEDQYICTVREMVDLQSFTIDYSTAKGSVTWEYVK